MNADPPELDRIQRWMQSVIIHPDGVPRGIESRRARAEIDIAPHDVERVITRSRAQSSIERLQIYANAYYARLLECLREEYPALLHAVGDDAFGAFAFGYLQSYPSRSDTLANLSAKFPQYLEETRPADNADEHPGWADFVVDLARLERAYSEVFDGPGVENVPLLRESDLRNITPAEWPRVRLVPVVCLRLTTFRFPVHEYASAVRRQEAAVPPAPAPTFLAITRRRFVVRRIPLSRPQFELLSALVKGESVADSIAQAAGSVEMGFDEFATRLHDWFRDWSANGFFLRAELPN